MQALWLGLIIVGVVWLKLADKFDTPKLAADQPQQAETAAA